jgi:hypothetical protein
MFDMDDMDELIRAAMDEASGLGIFASPEISRFGNGNIQFSYDTGHDHIDILTVCRFRQSLHDRLYKLHGNRLGGLVGLTIETRVESVYEARDCESLAICVTFAPLE